MIKVRNARFGNRFPPVSMEQPAGGGFRVIESVDAECDECNTSWIAKYSSYNRKGHVTTNGIGIAYYEIECANPKCAGMDTFDDSDLDPSSSAPIP